MLSRFLFNVCFRSLCTTRRLKICSLFIVLVLALSNLYIVFTKDKVKVYDSIYCTYVYFHSFDDWRVFLLGSEIEHVLIASIVPFFVILVSNVVIVMALINRADLLSGQQEQEASLSAQDNRRYNEAYIL